MQEPLLSIIIISYENSSLVLRRAIQSVLEQSYKNYEVIVVDANKPDSPYSQGLREDMEQYPDIPVISCPCRKGEFAAAKNQGAEQANGTYLAFLMAKDAWNQECAASQVEVLEEKPEVGLVFCHSWMQEEDALSIGYRTAPELPAVWAGQRDPLSHEMIHSVSQVIFRRTAFEGAFGFDTHIHKQDDYDMWIRLAKKHRIAAIDQNLVCSYVEKGLLRKSHKLVDVVGYLQLYSKHRDVYRKNPEARYRLYQKIASCYQEEGRYLTWFKYSLKIRMLEMRLGKKKNLETETKAALPEYDVVSTQDKEYIAIVKRMDGGTTGLGVPEEGAEFQIYLKEAGSYEAAKANERDELICDSNGYAKSKALSQGVYVVHQTKGQSGTERLEDFEVTLDRVGKTHTMALLSAPESFYVKVTRKDGETGKVIPVAGGAYRITDSEARPVIMNVTYPQPQYLETFATSDKGYFITPSRLIHGTYNLSEQKAPEGYVKNGITIPFVVSRERTVTENGFLLVSVETENIAQKGRIFLHKKGPVVPRVQVKENTMENGNGYQVGGPCIYRPYFEEGNVEGAIYEITAQEDIITPDGTLRTPKDTVVCTLTTDSEGNAVSPDLYLGRYQIEEKEPAHGLLRNPQIQEAELVYDDNGELYTRTEAAFEGERQKISIHLEKALGEDNIFHIGGQGEIKDFAFGLFAAEDLPMADGSVIPRDGLLDIQYCDEDGKICFHVELPYGDYYVKEIRSNSHYRCSGIRYPLRFAYQEGEAADLYVNEGRPITSEMIRGTIQGVKTDPGNHPISMAEIGLFPMGADLSSREKAALVSVTDWNGTFSFRDIPCGDYVVKELSVPQGYIKNEAAYYISLTFDEQRIDLKLISPRL